LGTAAAKAPLALPKEVWSAELPASAHAQPITFEIHGRQFVIIAAGGSAKIDEESLGDAVVVDALPER
jgi:quinoprotein glucose dehydrogenase